MTWPLCHFFKTDSPGLQHLIGAPGPGFLASFLKVGKRPSINFIFFVVKCGNFFPILGFLLNRKRVQCEQPKRTAVYCSNVVNIHKDLPRQVPNPRAPLLRISGTMTEGWGDLLQVIGKSPKS